MSVDEVLNGAKPDSNFNHAAAHLNIVDIESSYIGYIVLLLLKFTYMKRHKSESSRLSRSFSFFLSFFLSLSLSF